GTGTSGVTNTPPPGPGQVFVRDPGGCACSVPSPADGNRGALAWAGLALAGALMLKRRGSQR
ncbi:MAG TPA: MYXO-CTERM sorting domain-containing protein, partial [Polyangiaceae bacterium]